MQTSFTVKVVFSDEDRDSILNQLYGLWQEIGGDLEAVCQEQGTRMKNSDVLECLLDAQRLETRLEERSHSRTVMQQLEHRRYVQALSKFRLLDFKQQKAFLGRDNLRFV